MCSHQSGRLHSCCCRGESDDVATESLHVFDCCCGLWPHACMLPATVPAMCLQHLQCRCNGLLCSLHCAAVLSDMPQAPASNPGDCRANLSHLDSIIFSACALQCHRLQHPDQVVAGELGQRAIAQLECLLHHATALQPSSMHSAREIPHDSSRASGLQWSQHEHEHG